MRLAFTFLATPFFLASLNLFALSESDCGLYQGSSVKFNEMDVAFGLKDTPGYLEFLIATDFQLGRNGKEKNLGKAIEIYARSAALGYLPADYALGIINYVHIGNPAGYIKAAELFSRLDKRNYDPATYMLALMYLRGAGVPKDREQAISLLRKAARSGYVNAQLRLAEELDQPEVLTDTVKLEAFCWFSAAANTEAQAQYKVGLFLEKRSGASTNSDVPLRWYCTALANGNNSALELLSARHGIRENINTLCKFGAQVVPKK